VPLAARAFVYGLACVQIDDHLRQWTSPSERPDAAIGGLRIEKP
jgi:hypothetical protein